jgi:hypothetical protein
MEQRVRLSIPDHQIGASAQDGFDESRDLVARVLVIGVGINEDISPEGKRLIDPRHERDGEPLVFTESKDVLDAEFPCDAGGLVRAPVVDHEHLDAVDPRNLSREPGQGLC